MAYTFSQPTQFNYRLPSGEIVAATINPDQAATVDVAQVLSGKVASAVPQELLNIARNQLAGSTPVYDSNKAVQNAGAVPTSDMIPSFSPSLGQAPTGYVNPNANYFQPGQGGNPIQNNQGTPGVTNTYTIKAGDSLSKIATQYGIAWQQLYEANKGVVGANPNLIKPGQVLTIPGATQGGTAPQGEQASGVTPTGVVPKTPTYTSGGVSASGQGVTGVQTGPVTDIGTLNASAEMVTLQKKIQDQRDKILAGVGTTKTAILTEEFEKAGIKEQLNLRQALDQEILRSTRELRALPDAIKNRLQDIGVTEDQLSRLTAREAQKPREILRDLLEQRGVLSSAISDSMEFVKLFANTRWEDQMVKLEAEKFMLDELEGDYKDLRADQKEYLKLAFEQKEAVAKIAGNLIELGAPQKAIDDVLAQANEADALSVAAKYSSLFVEEKTPKVIGSSSTGYLQFNSKTGLWEKIVGTGDGQADGQTGGTNAFPSSLIEQIEQWKQMGSPQESILNALKWNISQGFTEGKGLSDADLQKAVDYVYSGSPTPSLTNLTPTNKRELEQAGLVNVDGRVQTFYLNADSSFRDYWSRNVATGDIDLTGLSISEMEQIYNEWLSQKGKGSSTTTSTTNREP